jgi:hypothetical protein
MEGFMIGVAIGFVGGLVIVFFVWKNNRDRMQALGTSFLEKIK